MNPETYLPGYSYLCGEDQSIRTIMCKDKDAADAAWLEAQKARRRRSDDALGAVEGTAIR
ncbi:MAG TPA: hypothetical protein VNY05_06065 [Candidatus Acidoferrales bacterium]|nr:hypothetical protein [Candidatus Acidoferrales bacterium]